jgi:hypothetical protein
MKLAIPKIGWPSARRAISSVTLLAYLACAIGFPMPDAAARAGSACGPQGGCCSGTAAQCHGSGCGCTPAPKGEIKTCCARTVAQATKSCCNKQTSTKAQSKESKPTQIRWVIGLSAQKCRGGQTNWVSADVALPGPPPADWQPNWPFCHSLSVWHVQSPSLLEAPRDPPPRLAIA